MRPPSTLWNAPPQTCLKVYGRSCKGFSIQMTKAIALPDLPKYSNTNATAAKVPIYGFVEIGFEAGFQKSLHLVTGSTIGLREVSGNWLDPIL